MCWSSAIISSLSLASVNCFSLPKFLAFSEALKLSSRVSSSVLIVSSADLPSSIILLSDASFPLRDVISCFVAVIFSVRVSVSCFHFLTRLMISSQLLGLWMPIFSITSLTDERASRIFVLYSFSCLINCSRLALKVPSWVWACDNLFAASCDILRAWFSRSCAVFKSPSIRWISPDEIPSVCPAEGCSRDPHTGQGTPGFSFILSASSIADTLAFDSSFDLLRACSYFSRAEALLLSANANSAFAFAYLLSTSALSDETFAFSL